IQARAAGRHAMPPPKKPSIEAPPGPQVTAPTVTPTAAQVASPTAEVANPAPTAAPPPVPAPPTAHKVTAADRARLSEREKQTTLVFGHRFNMPLRQKGRVVAQIQAHVSTEEVIRRVL